MESEARQELADLVRWIHGKGWAPGTGGNFSSLLSRDPFRLLITSSGPDKGTVGPDDLLIVDEWGQIVKGEGAPSAETLLHVAIIQETEAEVVLHTHSIWNGLASLAKTPDYTISGFEMLKGLSGVTTHEHTERIPIFENSQDIPALSEKVRAVLRQRHDTHGVLLRGHGLYTWGHNSFVARRHLEVLEFLFELTGRVARMEH